MPKFDWIPDNVKAVVDIDPERAGGLPVLPKTRFTIAQLLAQIAQSKGVYEVGFDFDLNENDIKAVLNELSQAFKN